MSGNIEAAETAKRIKYAAVDMAFKPIGFSLAGNAGPQTAILLAYLAQQLVPSERSIWPVCCTVHVSPPKTYKVISHPPNDKITQCRNKTNVYISPK